MDVLVDMCGHAVERRRRDYCGRPARIQVAGGPGTPAPMGGTGIYDYARRTPPPRRRGCAAAGWAPDEHRAVLVPHTYQVGDAEAYKRHELNYKESREPTSRKDHGRATTPSCWRNRPHKVDWQALTPGCDCRELAHGTPAVDAQLGSTRP